MAQPHQKAASCVASALTLDKDDSLLLPALRHSGFQCFLNERFLAITRHGLEWLPVH